MAPLGIYIPLAFPSEVGRQRQWMAHEAFEYKVPITHSPCR